MASVVVAVNDTEEAPCANTVPPTTGFCQSISATVIYMLVVFVPVTV